MATRYFISLINQINCFIPRSHTLNSNKTEKITKIPQSDELNLSTQIKERLLMLQNKGLDLNQILGELLDQREERIQEEKQEIAEELQTKDQLTQQPQTTRSRYIPKKIRDVVKMEHGEKCARSNCTNQSVNTHHQQRFSLDPRHNPIYLLPLCKSHHEIAHAIDVKVVKKRGATYQ